MADQVNNLRLQVANALTLADELLALELSDHSAGRVVEGELLKREVEVVLGHARAFAGLNPDGSFDKVPPAKLKKGGKP